MKIVELILKLNGQVVPQAFTVGAAPMKNNGEILDQMGIVESITFNRHAYNKGFQIEGASYTVAFVDSDIRTVIPAEQIAQVKIDIEKSKKASDDGDTASPELPD